MPWRAVESHPDCSGPAVVQSDTGALVTCHVTMAEAEAHAAALYANMDEEHRSAYFDQLADVPNFRSIPMADVEMRDNGDAYAFDGLAAPTGAVADFDLFTEEYERGSFRRYLAKFGKDHNIPFCHEHDPKQLLGTTRSGRVKLDEDAKGLRTRANVVKTELSERIKALVDSGDVGGMSIGMVVGRGNARVSLRSGRPHRSITGFKRLLDVCTTFDPAYPTTEAQFRSAAIQLASSSPDLLQQVLLGAYPQLQHGAAGSEPVGDDDEDDAGDDAGDGDGSGAVGDPQEVRSSIAARKRALQFLILTTGGIDDHAS